MDIRCIVYNQDVDVEMGLSIYKVFRYTGDSTSNSYTDKMCRVAQTFIEGGIDYVVRVTKNMYVIDIDNLENIKRYELPLLNDIPIAMRDSKINELL